MSAAVRMGTRGSMLARGQSALVAAQLERVLSTRVELVEITSAGDVTAEPLALIGGTGVFVSALREALLDGHVDVVVHSLKDLPTWACPGVELVAVPTREDPRDVLVSAGDLTLAQLRPGARVGTGSPRRAAFLRAARPDIEVTELRGNVDTRLGYVAAGRLDAVVLAAAGLHRLGRAAAVSEYLEPAVMLPAPGQGALAVELAANAPAHLRAGVGLLDDVAARAEVLAERSVLAELEAGCSAPVGALARAGELSFWEPQVELEAAVASLDGTLVLRRRTSGPVFAASELGRKLARTLLGDGAAELMAAAVAGGAR